jgi:very-long-chain enoyl-CoA reductase
MVILKWKGKRTPVETTSSTHTADLVKDAAKITGLHSSRLRIYVQRDGDLIQLQPQEAISSFNTDEFLVVDSGPQLSFRLDNLIEYIPPIFIWLLIVWLSGTTATEYLKTATLMWMLHYTKRTLEAAFVHVYSQPTLPIWSLKDNSSVKNCAYYWGFAVAMTVSVLFASRSKSEAASHVQQFGRAIFVLSEILNGYCHLALRKLRPKGSLAHVCPRGFLYNRITCPNYTFEILSWVAFAMYAQTIIAIVFPIVGGAQMFIWADEKRTKLALSFPEVAQRGRITPFKFV